MIELAHNEYKYEQDHRLNDTIAGIANISFCIGEIIGPIFGSFLCILFNFKAASSILATFYLMYACFYFSTIQKSRKVKNDEFYGTALIDY
jgi:Na+/alanine symporter